MRTQRITRFAGLLYLLQMTTGVFGFWAHGTLTAAGDPAQTARNIMASERLFRVGTLADVVTTVLVVTLTWALYVLLKPVDRNLALLAAFLRIVENAVAAAAIFMDFLALRLLHDTMYLQGFDAKQVQVLARLLVTAQGWALLVAFVFLGFGTAVFAHLWWRSRFIPRLLAGLGFVGALMLAFGSLAIMVFPALQRVLGLYHMMPLGLFEVGLGFWLLIKGVRAAQPILV